jgi:hypothetical protein
MSGKQAAKLGMSQYMYEALITPLSKIVPGISGLLLEMNLEDLNTRNLAIYNLLLSIVYRAWSLWNYSEEQLQSCMEVDFNTKTDIIDRPPYLFVDCKVPSSYPMSLVLSHLNDISQWCSSENLKWGDNIRDRIKLESLWWISFFYLAVRNKRKSIGCWHDVVYMGVTLRSSLKRNSEVAYMRPKGQLGLKTLSPPIARTYLMLAYKDHYTHRVSHYWDNIKQHKNITTTGVLAPYM